MPIFDSPYIEDSPLFKNGYEPYGGGGDGLPIEVAYIDSEEEVYTFLLLELDTVYLNLLIGNVELNPMSVVLSTPILINDVLENTLTFYPIKLLPAPPAKQGIVTPIIFSQTTESTFSIILGRAHGIFF